MKIIIVGASRIGAHLACALAGEKHEIAVVDCNPENFYRLGKDFPGLMVTGVGIDEGVLEQAGVKEADVLVAVTGNVNANLMTAQIAKVIYGVKKVVTLLPYEDPLENFFRKLGVKTISLPRLGARAIEKYLKEA